MHPRRTRRSFLAGLLRSGHTLATTTVNVAEVYAGMRVNEEFRTEAVFENLQIIPLPRSIARRAGLLIGSHARQGRTFALPDMTVAATALEFGFPVLTDNQEDFEVAGLKLYPGS